VPCASLRVAQRACTVSRVRTPTKWSPWTLLVPLVAGLAAPPLAVAALGADVARAKGVDARVTGTFAMAARVTRAYGIPGEHVGRIVLRTWRFQPLRCSGDVCAALSLERERSGHIVETLTLQRIAVGTYAGSGAFSVSLQCKGRLYQAASRVPYRITVRIVRVITIQGIVFAQSLAATYSNRSRTDSTPCGLGPAYDAARYHGTAVSPPQPPTASFTAAVLGGTTTAAFTSGSAPGPTGAPILDYAWDFGDPGSGLNDSSNAPSPTHEFSSTGSYNVSLTVTDANGLSATSAQVVVVPPPEPAPSG
jgi:PKD domain